MQTKTIWLTTMLIVALWSSPAVAGVPEAVTYLQGQTQDAWITQALIAAGEVGVSTDHLTSVAEGGFNPTNDYAKTILALAAVGENSTTFGEIDYVAKLKTYYDGNQMGDNTLLNDDIWSLLALASIYETGCPEAIAAKDFLLANQNGDGGWGYAVGGNSGSNDTAAAIMALIEAGVDVNDVIITNAVTFLHTLQNDDGGFMNDPAWGTDSDSGSDAWVISAIYKIGQDPTTWIKNGSTSIDHINTLQDADGGFWWVDPASNPAFNNKAMTPYTVIALAGKSFPIGYYAVPPVTRISTDKSTYNNGKEVTITVEYAQYIAGESWLALEGAIISGANRSYITDASGQVSMVLPSADYSLSAKKDGYVNSASIGITVLPAPVVIVPQTNNGSSNNNQPSVSAPSSTNENIETVEPETEETTEIIDDDGENENEEVLGVKVEEEAPVDQTVLEAESMTQKETKDFMEQGTESTEKLGAGERAGVLNSYKSTFGKAPETQEEWVDAIKIANGEMPITTNVTAEDKAKLEFKKIYDREFDLEDAKDQKIINMMAYGLRPVKRYLDLEREGIKKFVEIYKYLPTSAIDWDAVRAIAYNK